MKKLIALIGLLLLTNLSFSQAKADDIIGKYLSPTKEGAIEIYKTNNKYYGKLVWLHKPENLDTKNPDEKKRSQKLLNLEILKGFVFDNSSTWNDGTIYDPKSGKTYNCKITRETNGNLNIRGYLGFSLIGRTEVFTKLNIPEKK